METIDERFKRARKVFVEDECAPDAESLGAAWLRIFGEPRPKQCIRKADHGDAFVLEYPRGRFAQIGPPHAGWTEIRVIDEENEIEVF